MDPNYPNSQNYPNFQSFLNPEDYPNTQNSQDYSISQAYSNSQNYPNSQSDPNYQFSPNLNQIPISEQVQTSEHVSRSLFRETNQRMGKTSWSVKEDVALMSSWVVVSENETLGKNQRVRSFWSQVHKLYEEARVENPGEINQRNPDSLRGRCKRLTENVNKWVAALKEAHGRKRSGMSQQDIENEAHTIYAAGGSKFQDEHVFNEVMSKHPKWELQLTPKVRRHVDDEESGDSSKRSRTSVEGSYSIPIDQETPGSGGSTISRPTGRDKAKKKRER